MTPLITKIIFSLQSIKRIHVPSFLLPFLLALSFFLPPSLFLSFFGLVWNKMSRIQIKIAKAIFGQLLHHQSRGVKSLFQTSIAFFTTYHNF